MGGSAYLEEAGELEEGDLTTKTCFDLFSFGQYTSGQDFWLRSLTEHDYHEECYRGQLEKECQISVSSIETGREYRLDLPWKIP